METTTTASNSTGNLLVIRASAGSGKTYNLALQYIKHLLFTTGENGELVPRRGTSSTHPVNAHRILLAITFTNKATDEMKDRIVKELYRLSQPGVPSDYLEGFVSESGLSEDRVRDLARQALSELLFDYSNFNVSTIDSFFQTILRNFARELDRDFNYDIQLEEKYAVRVALHNFLLSLGKEGQPSQVDLWVKEYMRQLTHGNAEKRRWKFFDDGGELLSFAEKINTEEFRSNMAAVRDYLGHVDDNGDFVSDFSRIRAFKKLVHGVAEGLERTIQEGLAALRQALEPLAEGLYGGRSFSTFMAQGGTEPLKKDSWKVIDESKVNNQFKSKARPDEETISRLVQLVREHFNARNGLDFFKEVEKNLGLLGMMAMIDLYLERYRQETNSILIGDTNELIGTVLESGSDFVYERVGTTISHFMIDEFQDTSTKQYENFRGLLDESLSNGNFNMLIGDAKQSIYRFRNADPTVFRERVGEDFAAEIYQPPVEPGKPQSTNFRSSPAIIRFNNELFSFARDCYADLPAVVKSYQDVCQGMPPGIESSRVPGYVRLFTGNYGALTAVQGINEALQMEGYGVDPEASVKVLDILPAYLLQLHERFDWGRIGMLVNSNNQGKQIVERILDYNRCTTGEPINIISGESLLLNNSAVVRRIIALLRFIDISQYSASEEDADTVEEDNEAQGKDWLLQRLKHKRLSDQRLYVGLSRFIQAIAAHPSEDPVDNGRRLVEALNSLGTAADSRQEDEEIRHSVEDIVRQLLPAGNELTTLVSIVENIIAYFKRDHQGVADVDRETAFLLAFQDAIQQFASMRNGGSVREFLKFWDEKKDKLTVSTSDTGDAINIMTIHKAKGLEFECVVIPFANWELNDNSKESVYWMKGDTFADVLDVVAPDWKDGVGDDVVPPLLCVPKSGLVHAYENGLLRERAREFVVEQRTAVVIDNLNKTYVAMTRPCTELHLFADEGKNNDLKPLLQNYVQSSQLMTPVIGSDGQPVAEWYECGVVSSREEIDAKRNESPSTALNVPIDRYTVTGIPPSIMVRLEQASGPRVKAGLRLHGLLSQIRDRRDVDRVIARALKHGVITTGDPDDPCGQENVEARVRGPIMDEHCRVSAWFDPANKVYSERTITTADFEPWSKDGMQNLRPDRIIRRPDGQILVIDYKSGERNDKRYCAQVKRYMSRLRAVFPGSPIAGRIWYVTHGLIIDENGHELPMLH